MHNRSENPLNTNSRALRIAELKVKSYYLEKLAFCVVGDLAMWGGRGQSINDAGAATRVHAFPKTIVYETKALWFFLHMQNVCNRHQMPFQYFAVFLYWPSSDANQ